MYKIKLLILLLLLSPVALAAGKGTGKSVDAGGGREVGGKAVTKQASWNIDPYPEKNGRLPRNYQGVTPAKFLEIFKEKVEAFRKEDVRPQGGMSLQADDLDAILSPIKASELYAFRKQDIISWYDKIGHYFVFRSREEETFCDELSAEWNTCKIEMLRSSPSLYTGRFDEGAETVERTNIIDFALAIRKANSVFQSPAFIYDFTRMGFEYMVWMPAEEAQKIQGKKLGVLFVGSVEGAEIMDGKETLSTPSFLDPTEIYTQEEAIPFALKKLVFYVVETGQILRVDEIQP